MFIINTQKTQPFSYWLSSAPLYVLLSIIIQVSSTIPLKLILLKNYILKTCKKKYYINMRNNKVLLNSNKALKFSKPRLQDPGDKYLKQINTLSCIMSLEEYSFRILYSLPGIKSATLFMENINTWGLPEYSTNNLP